MPSPTLLYQFALSHYCEKVRWALDYKNIPYKTINLIPGPHLLVTKRLAPKTSVPILIHEGKTIQDSTDILNYLDKIYPQKSLTPTDENLKKEAIEWEEYLDQEVGLHLRRFLYHHVLPDNRLISSLLLQNAPWYGPALYAVTLPLLKKFMRKSMNIHEASSKRSEKRLSDALERMNNIVKNQPFLVGNQFSRADLTAASLLAPLCTPCEHSFEWPAEELMPKPLVAFKKDHEADPAYSWVLKTYQNHRTQQQNQN